jgi:PIN domain nuclease of toxin-antitoxin system
VSAVLLDTHAWVWSLTGDDRLSQPAAAAIMEADAVFVSPIALFEIGQKVRHGKWPEMQPFVNDLPDLLEEQGGRMAALHPRICLAAALLDWAHHDPFDRLLAATALDGGLTLVSADTQFDELADGVRIKRIW